MRAKGEDTMHVHFPVRSVTVIPGTGRGRRPEGAIRVVWESGATCDFLPLPWQRIEEVAAIFRKEL